jgi:hypothetical protein
MDVPPHPGPGPEDDDAPARYARQVCLASDGLPPCICRPSRPPRPRRAARSGRAPDGRPVRPHPRSSRHGPEPRGPPRPGGAAVVEVRHESRDAGTSQGGDRPAELRVVLRTTASGPLPVGTRPVLRQGTLQRHVERIATGPPDRSASASSGRRAPSVRLVASMTVVRPRPGARDRVEQPEGVRVGVLVRWVVRDERPERPMTGPRGGTGAPTCSCRPGRPTSSTRAAADR